MSYILFIESATSVCSVSLIDNDFNILSNLEDTDGNNHSELLTYFIDESIKQANLKPNDLSAVAVSEGPGSYTGLRIGVSAAKGLCYALNIPLIAINTLKSMAYGVVDKIDNETLLCPMIDARRMEVYTTLFNKKMEQITEIEPKIINEDSFKEYLSNNKIMFFGDGSEKCKSVLTSENAIFNKDFLISSTYMKMPAFEKFNNKNFENVAYFEPFYLKEFKAVKSKVKGLN
ncbi:MAG: tRNA (adenosine(37)-N6)-threonylcarbamoyltransferase complex dimerization subunit type 1 TsaB [Bacteroidales bacterium]|jgi:tRNA threonylcarbamoyladenosine biosynthesis protein TsaB